jgi:zinc protease
MRTTLIGAALIGVLASAQLTDAKAPSPYPTPYPGSPIADWNLRPPPTKEPMFTVPSAKRMKLANGMGLLVVENHALPIASFVLLVPGAGTAADPKGKFGIAAFAADLLDEGAGGMGALQISEELDRLGAALGVSASLDAAYVSASVLTKTMDPALDVITKVITQPAFDPKEFERVTGDRATALELRRDRPREVAAIMLDAALYGADSAYGHPGAGTREQFKALTVGDAKAFYQAHWNPTAMTLVVAGDVDAKALKAKLDAGLGAWKVKGAQKPAAPRVALAKRTTRLLVADRKEAAQSDVRVGLVGIERKDPRAAQYEVLLTTLGGGFTSRLVQRLREGLGIVYNISARQQGRLTKAPVVIACAIQTPASGRGLGEILSLVDALATTDIPAEELDKVKQNLIRALPENFGTNAATAGTFADLVLNGLPDNHYAGYAARIRAVTAKQVRALAKSALPSGQLVFSVVGDLAKIEADITKLNLGKPAMFDLYGVAAAP